MKFKKQPLTFEKQVALLKSRGLGFADEKKALDQLANVGYFRLRAYMFPFKKAPNEEVFKPGVTWKDVYELYAFDRKLRLLVFDAIEKIEVSIRTQMVHVLSHKYGTHWQDIPGIYAVGRKIRLKDGTLQTVDVYREVQRHIKEQLRSLHTEWYIEHYRKTYTEPINPPSWMCIEVMYFSQLSRICSNLAYRNDVVNIAKHFDLPPSEFVSWLHAMSYIRNLCAHHARLWNRELKIVPMGLKFSKNRKWMDDYEISKSKVYYTLCMLNYFLQTVNPNTSFTMRLKNLICEYKPPLEAMGFPDGWLNEPLWK